MYILYMLHVHTIHAHTIHATCTLQVIWVVTIPLAISRAMDTLVSHGKGLSCNDESKQLMAAENLCGLESKNFLLLYTLVIKHSYLNR